MPASPSCRARICSSCRWRLAAAQDAVDEVRPIERSDQHQRIAQPQLGDDVAADALGRRRGEGVERDAGKSSRSAPELPVSGRKSWPHWLMQCASSMAMKRTAGLLQQPAQPADSLADQPLGRHVEQAAAVLAQRSPGPASRSCGCSELFRYDGRRRRRRAGRRPDPSSAR